MPEGDTTIHVSESTWRRLHEKKGPGDSHDDILQDVLDEYDQHKTTENGDGTATNTETDSTENSVTAGSTNQE